MAQRSHRFRLWLVVCLGLSLLCSTPSLGQSSPELAMRDFSSGQIKKGVRSIGFGGDGATWGNYGLVWRDAGTALVQQHPGDIDPRLRRHSAGTLKWARHPKFAH